MNTLVYPINYLLLSELNLFSQLMDNLELWWYIVPLTLKSPDQHVYWITTELQVMLLISSLYNIDISGHVSI